MLNNKLFNTKTVLAEYRNNVWRVIESQEEAATLSVVDDTEEQMLLEGMLDNIKPAYRKGTEGMHYLLKTAFRYPPLKWGSRFGSPLLPSYFYASEAPATALSECAYYRFLFLEDMIEDYKESIRSEFCVFSVLVASNSCLDLTASKYSSHQEKISNPQSYSVSQAIGHWAYQRDDIAIIRFASARNCGGINLAVSNPDAIRSKKPSTQERWQCLSKSDLVSFSSRASNMSFIYSREQFCDDAGTLLRVNQK